MTKPTCTIPDCDRPVRALSMCDAHFQRHRAGKRGAELEAPIAPRAPTTGTCTIDGCERRRSKAGLCTTHYKRRAAGEDLSAPIRDYAYQGDTCSVDGCTNPPHAHTLCGMHHQRALRHATPERTPPTPEERFWSQVDRSGGEHSCWPWTGNRRKSNYGLFAMTHTKTQHAHIAAYVFTYGPVPDGCQVDHTCHNAARARGECAGGPACPHRACQNPAHLEAVTPAENARRRSEAQTHCKRGHEFTPENTYVHDGMRICRTCKALRARERKNRSR